MGFGGYLAYRTLRIIGRLLIILGIFGLIMPEPKGSAVTLVIGFIIEAYGQFKQRTRNL